MKLADLFIKLGLDSKDFNAGIDDASKKTNSFSAEIKKIGGLIAGAFALSSIKDFAENVLQLGKESIKAENELAAAIKANGKEIASTLSSYERFTKEMMAISTIDDEAISGLLRLAETLQSDAPKEAVKNAMALSKALDVDLKTALKMAIMAQSDSYTMLNRYSGAMREANTETERAAEYNKIVASGLIIMSEEVSTNIGKAEQLTIAWDNVKESIGKTVLESGFLKEILSDLQDYIAVFSDPDFSQGKFWRAIFGGDKSMRKLANDARDRMEEQDKAIERNIEKKKAAAEINALFGQSVNDGLNEPIFNAIKKIKEETAVIDENTDAVSANKKKREKVTGFDSMIKPVTDIEPFSDTSGKLGKLWLEIPAGFQTESMKQLAKDEKAILEERAENWNSFEKQMANIVVDFGTDVVEQFGMAFGELLRTGDLPDDFGDQILSSIGGFISQLGKMLIGLGIASEAFQALLKSAFTNPVAAGLAIAAGAALVLLGGAIKGYAKGGMSGSTSGSVSSPASYSGSNYGNSGARYENNQVEFVIKGNTLVGVLNNTKRTVKNIG